MKPKIDTLGTVRIHCASTSGAPCSVSQAKRIALLVFLAVDQPGLPVQRDLLLGLLWPGLDSRSAHRALRQALYQLRQLLGYGVIRSQGQGAVVLPTEGVLCDASRLKRALFRGRLRTAVALYRGEFLPGFHLADCQEFERWIETERDAFRSRAGSAARALAERSAAANRLDSAVRYARRAVEIGPYSELNWRCLVRLLAANGDEVGAALAHSRMVQCFADALGLPPSHASRLLLGQLGIAPVAAS